jgi:hypothetical protein
MVTGIVFISTRCVNGWCHSWRNKCKIWLSNSTEVLHIYMMKLCCKWIKSFLIDWFNVEALLNATPHAPTTIFASLDFISNFILGLWDKRVLCFSLTENGEIISRHNSEGRFQKFRQQYSRKNVVRGKTSIWHYLNHYRCLHRTCLTTDKTHWAAFLYQ